MPVGPALRSRIQASTRAWASRKVSASPGAPAGDGPRLVAGVRFSHQVASPRVRLTLPAHPGVLHAAQRERVGPHAGAAPRPRSDVESALSDREACRAAAVTIAGDGAAACSSPATPTSPLLGTAVSLVALPRRWLPLAPRWPPSAGLGGAGRARAIPLNTMLPFRRGGAASGGRRRRRAVLCGRGAAPAALAPAVVAGVRPAVAASRSGRRTWWPRRSTRRQGALSALVVDSDVEHFADVDRRPAALPHRSGHRGPAGARGDADRPGLPLRPRHAQRRHRTGRLRHRPAHSLPDARPGRLPPSTSSPAASLRLAPGPRRWRRRSTRSAPCPWSWRSFGWGQQTAALATVPVALAALRLGVTARDRRSLWAAGLLGALAAGSLYLATAPLVGGAAGGDGRGHRRPAADGDAPAAPGRDRRRGRRRRTLLAPLGRRLPVAAGVRRSAPPGRVERALHPRLRLRRPGRAGRGGPARPSIREASTLDGAALLTWPAAAAAVAALATGAARAARARRGRSAAAAPGRRCPPCSPSSCCTRPICAGCAPSPTASSSSSPPSGSSCRCWPSPAGRCFRTACRRLPAGHVRPGGLRPGSRPDLGPHPALPLAPLGGGAARDGDGRRPPDRPGVRRRGQRLRLRAAHAGGGPRG